MPLKLYDIDTAPNEAIADELRNSEQAFGFVPNLHKAFAASHSALVVYKGLHEAFQNTSFNSDELTVVWQTINNFHECHYCVPAHTAVAHMMKVDETLINALNNGEKLEDPKLAALQVTTLEITEKRGHLSESTKKAFFDVGYGEQQLVEILVGLSQKVMSNYLNHMSETPLDEPFAKFAK